MKKRFGIILIGFLTMGLAACSTTSPANVGPTPGQPPRLAAPAVAPAGTEDYQSLHASRRAAVPAARTSVTARRDGRAPSLATPAGRDHQSLSARRDGRAPSVAAPSATPTEDFQSLHATYGHLPR
jgi:uncharacterized lipoprotein